ncbi:MAG TPA: Crp/Fnr family transcriptional regulator [Rhodanobacteraceae bacterium]|nr:Crp/Fnr family transcriptional regulator [Rhodanobacteraceae bacterium]
MSVVDQLERFDAFATLSSQARALLSRGAVERQFARRAAVLHKGEPISGAYFVLEGRLRAFTITPGGTEATLYFIGPGETCVFALNCLFGDVLYPSWVQAECASRVALIPGAVYRRLFESEIAIQNLTIGALSVLVYRLISELDGIHASNHRQRLAQFILTHASSSGCLRMTQQQLGNHIGTTREVVARLMQEFVAAGYVKTLRGAIEIRDLFALRRVIAPDAPAGPRARS